MKKTSFVATLLFLSLPFLTGCGPTVAPVERAPSTLKFKKRKVRHNGLKFFTLAKSNLLYERIGQSGQNMGGVHTFRPRIRESQWGKSWTEGESVDIESGRRVERLRMRPYDTKNASHFLAFVQGGKKRYSVGCVSVSDPSTWDFKLLDAAWDRPADCFAAAGGKTIVVGKKVDSELQLYVSRNEGQSWKPLNFPLEYAEAVRDDANKLPDYPDWRAEVDYKGRIHLLARNGKDHDFYARIEGKKLAQTHYFAHGRSDFIAITREPANEGHLLLLFGHKAKVDGKSVLKLSFLESADGGDTFGPLRHLANASRKSKVAWKASSKIIMCSWLSKVGPTELMTCYSLDHGKTWTEPEVVASKVKELYSVALKGSRLAFGVRVRKEKYTPSTGNLQGLLYTTQVKSES